MNKIDEFLQHKAKNTKQNYKSILNEYFRTIKHKPDTYFKDKNRDFKKDVNEWWLTHIDEVPLTRNTRLNILKTFLEEYDVLFPKKFWKKLRGMRKGSRAATMDRVPSHAEFRQILQHGTIKDKALFLFAGSSGMRIDEILKLKPENVDLEHDPPMVTIPGDISKTGDPRITFITPECKEYLELWYQERDNYLDVAYRKTKQLCKKNKRVDTIFPFVYNLAWTRWTYLIKKAGVDKRDPTTNRYLLHIHSLRKWFLSQLKLKIPVVIAEALAGHEEYLDNAYRRYTKEQIGGFYLQGMDNLTIFEREPDLSDVNKEIEELRKENESLRRDMDKLMRKVLIDNYKV